MQINVTVGEYYHENLMSAVSLQMKSVQFYGHEAKENCREME